jgi:multidrug resistance efflux pump
VAGRIVSLPAASGKLVQQGDVLAAVDTSEAGQ